ncbi:MAG: hypothetical protein F6K25_05425 [Okeania sp. SIO2G4]|uniref:hypothetical protein n=1 Tax=unclassified Okeania TaxID=2634635 RepID=UPI0013B83C87|nr:MULTISPECIES: hypothetical protein [unclassified Okeania]NEP07171.1 hypothetical protein [Okeania sp. SIO4D6]NEP71249.1 hypothetical protein [Okeania sp. SIO2G5]NEP92163.1 hypothetical protein [Okeania sp. SIO2F5]NEQ90192.1 hypothetical protein [Okeania sp. SIO2G4]
MISSSKYWARLAMSIDWINLRLTAMAFITKTVIATPVSISLSVRVSTSFVRICIKEKNHTDKQV